MQKKKYCDICDELEMASYNHNHIKSQTQVNKFSERQWLNNSSLQ